MKWITASQLEAWADTAASELLLPLLLRDLITASARNISDIRFPSGDVGRIPGFDGTLKSDGAPLFVPEGSAVWELGTGNKPVEKANGDYGTRTASTSDEERGKTTFVFVTPRTLRGTITPHTWVEVRRKEGGWKDVRFIDGVTLEEWLSRAPAVASHWAKTHLNLVPPRGAKSSDEFWNHFSLAYEHGLREEVVLAGREEQGAALVRKLIAGERRISFTADSPDEVIAFVVAAIRKASPVERLFLENRTMVVESEDAAQHFSNIEGLIFLPRDKAASYSHLLLPRGPTVLANGPGPQRNDAVRLARPTTAEFAAALRLMGFEEAKALEHARGCNRTLSVLARRIPSGNIVPPAWMLHGPALVPAMLAGGWRSSNTADVQVLPSLAAVANYEAWEGPLRSLTELTDPPIDRLEDLWMMRSQLDAFMLLGHRLGAEHFERLKAVFSTVFVAPADVPQADQPYRPWLQPNDSYSEELRRGLLGTLLNFAFHHQTARLVIPGTTPDHWVRELVSQLPGLNTDPNFMASFREELPMLAEAAAGPFLDALERMLEGDPSTMSAIFARGNSTFGSTSAHVYFLWSLERLAWAENLLPRVALILAKLAAIEPEGLTGNRPLDSLRSILLSWSPNTHASGATRDAVLRRVVALVPSIAWPLLAKLLPQHHDSNNVHEKPLYLETVEAPETLTFGVVWKSQDTVIELALERVSGIADRWGSIIGTIGHYRENSFKAALRQLDAYLLNADPEDHEKVWGMLRAEARRHQSFPDAPLAGGHDALNAMTKLVEQHSPKEKPFALTWLFDDWVPDIERSGSQAPTMELIEAERSKAVEAIMGSSSEGDGIAGLLTIAARAKVPHLLGPALVRLALTREQIAGLMGGLDLKREDHRSLASQLVSDSLSRLGELPPTLKQVLVDNGLVQEQAAQLFFGIRDSEEAWATVEEFDKDVAAAYWKSKHAFIVEGSLELSLKAAIRYLEAGRPMSAIEVLHMRREEVPSDFLLALLFEVAKQLDLVVPKVGHTMVEYYLMSVFEVLESRPDLDEEHLAKLQYVLFPLFSHREKALTLHRVLMKKPELFMELVRGAYLGSTQSPEDVTEAQRSAALAAYRILGDIYVIPGQSESGLDAAALNAWCDDVRRLSAESGLEESGEYRIGTIAAHAPIDPIDAAWPHAAVRDLIERYSSERVESGIRVERYNMRGAYWKAIGEGGKQERDLQSQYADWAKACRAWPRTSQLLREIAQSYGREADRADLEAEQERMSGRLG
ncbi:hypothetical protein [Roseateles sp. L2-2]|uniref:hypothetical protein n=1 Tax=Roseateles sp. L2-2 TaxID=3422597 RepID=UPI003D36C848